MTSTRPLEGHHALVCGASAGIGRAAALALGAAGAQVTGLARTRGTLEALRPQLRAAGAPRAHILVADLDDRADLEIRIVDHLRAHGPISILVNNAGGPAPGPLLEADDEAFLRAFGRHVLASHRLARLLVPGMTEVGYGRIINIVSTSVREPLPGLGVSNTIRGAVAAWSKTLANELPPGITINNVLPGFTDTVRLTALLARVAKASHRAPEAVMAEWRAQVPEGRIAQPEELGAVVAFLASPAASYVRGTNLPVDGGRLNSL